MLGTSKLPAGPFGRDWASNNKEGFTTAMKTGKTKLIVVLCVVGVLALLALSGVYRIDEGQQGLLLTFKEVTGYKDPGLYWRVPVIQTVEKVSTSQIHTLELGFRSSGVDASGSMSYTDVEDEALMLTGDDNLVRVEAVCQYSVRDAQAYLHEVQNPDETLMLAFETAMRRNIQNKELDDALLNKQDIEQEVLPDFQSMLDSYAIGVTVREIRIQNITVPTEVNAAYEDVNNAKNEKTRKLDEAERYKNEVIPAARSEAYQMVQEAEAYKAEVVSQATGDVANFTSVYEKYALDKDITRKRLMIETMEKILQNAQSKTILSADSELLQLLDIEGGDASK